MPRKHIMVIDSFEDIEQLLTAIAPDYEHARILTKENHDIVYAETRYTRIISPDTWREGTGHQWDRRELVAFMDTNGPNYNYHSPSAFAMSLYRSMTPGLFHMPMDGFKGRLSHDALYGGRCEVLQFGEFTAHQYDINSSYPYAAMSLRFPDPRTLAYTGAGTIENVLKNDGVSRVVFSQSGYLPVLPMRIAGRIYYVRADRAVGTYTHVELRYALRRGVRIHRIIKQYHAVSTLDPFTPYMMYCFRQRLATGLKMWKLLANALIGRFASIPHPMYSFHVAHDEQEIRDTDPRLLMRRGIIFVGQDLEPRISSNPLWASMVLSGARERIHDTAVRQSSTVYMDTDCVFVADPDPYATLSDAIGSFKHKVGDYTIKGAKLYAARYGDDSVITLRMKGIPLIRHNEREFRRQRFTNERFRYPDGSTRPFEYDQGVLL